MADDDVQEMNPAAPQDGQLAPWLADYREQAGGGPLDSAIVAIQQHVNARNVADANQAEGDGFVQDMASIKDGLTSVVQKDPTAADTAMEVAHRVTAAALDHAGVPEDKFDDTHADLSGHIRTEIAHTAVQSMAEINGPAARGMLDKYGSYFDDDQRGVADHYINAMEMARGVDHDAQIATAKAQTLAASQANAFGYTHQLLDPNTESVRFPDGWMQSVVKDQSVSPADKQALFDVYSRLRVGGDVPASDGFLAHDLLRGMSDQIDPQTRDAALSEVGKGLRFADAQMIHGFALQNTPEAAGQVRTLTNTLDQVRGIMTGASGVENGVAGANAFNKFVNWLLPSFRQTGGAGLNPAHESYLFANASPANFMPSAADLPRSTGTRSRSLGDIFGG